MFKFFKGKTELEKMEVQYKKLMEEAFRLSKQDRKASDAKYAEAEALSKKMELLREA